MTIERPQPPAGLQKGEAHAIEQLREEMKRLQHDIAFLKELLGHLKREFEAIKRQP